MQGRRSIGLFIVMALMTATMIPRAAFAKFYVVQSIADRQAAALQKTPVWCWAASIEMVLKNAKVHWSQTDIVTKVKGFAKVETASAYEITNFLNGWYFDYNGQPWKPVTKLYTGAPPPSVLVSEIRAKRPMIVTYKTGPQSGHAVVVYGALTDRRGDIHSVYLFDPFTGRTEAVGFDKFRQRADNTWLVKIYK